MEKKARAKQIVFTIAFYIAAGIWMVYVVFTGILLTGLSEQMGVLSSPMEVSAGDWIGALLLALILIVLAEGFPVLIRYLMYKSIKKESPFNMKKLVAEMALDSQPLICSSLEKRKEYRKWTVEKFIEEMTDSANQYTLTQLRNMKVLIEVRMPNLSGGSNWSFLAVIISIGGLLASVLGGFQGLKWLTVVIAIFLMSMVFYIFLPIDDRNEYKRQYLFIKLDCINRALEAKEKEAALAPAPVSPAVPPLPTREKPLKISLTLKKR